MVVLMGLHLLQVIIDGAYKAPREVNFWLGLILMQIVLGLSLTGYLLPWDQKGYYATQVATEIAGATPVIGPQVQVLVQGGPQYGHHTLTRFFALHTGVLPASLIGFLVLHIYVFRRHGITVPDPNRAPTTTFWPDQVLKDGIACLAVLATVMGLAIYFHGAELSAPANPAEAYSAARPEWYFLFLFRFLKFEAVEHFGLAFGAIYVPGAIMLIITVMPFIALVRGGHRFNVAFILLMAAGATGLTVLAMQEDCNNPSHQIAVKEAVSDGHRVQTLANAYGIPVEGALGLSRSDPLLQGPRIFAKTCSACHRYNGHDGTSRAVVQLEERDGEKFEVEAPATAADLGNFGSRDWTTAVLTDYRKTFSPLENASWYKDFETRREKGDKTLDGMELLDPASTEAGTMSQWCNENQAALKDPANAADLKALVEFLAAQSKRPGETYDPDLVTKGRDIYDGGALTKGSIESCTNCHNPIEEKYVSPTGDGSPPDLTGYASAEWLRDFISNPAHYYGGKNQMPAYREILSEGDLELLVKWMAGDYYKPKEAAASAH